MRTVLFALIWVVLCHTAYAQVPVTLAPVPNQQFNDSNGIPLAGGKLYTYLAGTNTLSPTFRDSLGVALNTDPIILDSGGRAVIWLAAISYKFVLQDRQGNQIWSIDNVSDLAYINGLNAMLLTGNQTAAGNKTFTGNTTITNLTLGTFDNFVYVDGVTYPTIQSAINALPVSGGTVYVPCGNYTLPTTLALTGPLVLQGCGMGSAAGGGGTRLIAGSGSLTPVVSVQGVSAAVRNTNVFIRDLTIAGVYTTTQTCMLIDHATYIIMDHVQFSGCGQAQWFNDVYRAVLTDMSYYQSGSGATNATSTVRVENVSNPGVVTSAIYFDKSVWQGDPGGKQGTGLWIGPSTTLVGIHNSVLDYSGGPISFPAINLFKANIVDLVNNKITDNQGTTPALGAIVITGDGTFSSSNVTISDNGYIGFSSTVPGVYVDYGAFVTINGNTFLGGNAGTFAIVDTAHSFGLTVNANRLSTLSDFILNDVGNQASAMNANPVTQQWDLRTPISTNKGLTIASGGLLTDQTANGPTFKRLRLNGGTAQTNANVLLAGGWGTGATTAITGDDSQMVVTVNSGTGTPTANPNVTITFADGSWGANPICIGTRSDGLIAPATATITATSSATSVTLTFIGTPAISSAYIFSSVCFGR
jgi:hypothetical protein